MAIRPIEFQGMIGNTQEISQNRNNEMQRPAIQQEHVATQNQQQVERSHIQISGSEESASQEFDPSRGGDGTGYQGNRGEKKEKKKEKKSEGRVIMKGKTKGFDASI